MALGATEHQFSFTTKDSLDLPGMTIDSQLNFNKQVSLICKKKRLQSAECYAVPDADLEIRGGGGSSRPLDKGSGVGLTKRRTKISGPPTGFAMIRFRKLYKAFVLPHFQYCSVVCHFCSSRNSEKLEPLNKRALREVFNERESTYSQLLDREATTSLNNLRVQNMLVTIHKCQHINFYPAYLKDYQRCAQRSTLLQELIYCHCTDLHPLLMVFTLLRILPVKLGTLYQRTLERSLLWLVLNL